VRLRGWKRRRGLVVQLRTSGIHLQKGSSNSPEWNFQRVKQFLPRKKYLELSWLPYGLPTYLSSSERDDKADHQHIASTLTLTEKSAKQCLFYLLNDMIENERKMEESCLASLRVIGLKLDCDCWSYHLAFSVGRRKELFHQLVAEGSPVMKSISVALVPELHNESDIRSVVQTLARYQPTVKGVTMLIFAFGKNGNVGRARRTYEEMLDAGIKPDNFTFNSLIDMYGKGGV